MGFFLFLLVNATLFLRPSEIFPALAEAHIYEALILGCFAFSIPAVLKLFFDLASSPMTIGVLLLWMFCVLSQVMQLDFNAAGEMAVYIFKVVVYYVLLVSVVSTPHRLRVFLYSLGFFVSVLTLIAVLRYTEIIIIAAPPTIAIKVEKRGDEKKDDGVQPYVEDKFFDARIGEEVIVKRLRGTGIFNDPNDLCLALVFGVLLCLFGLTDPRLGAFRILCVLPLGLFLIALRMTYSRGGLLGLFAGLGILFLCRYGWKKSLLLGMVTMPLVLAMFGGRMTALTASEGTGQSRIQLWRDGVVEFRYAPLFGVGMNRYQAYAGQVAHNSFIHAFTELGFLGGATFLGMFYYAFWALRRVQRGWIYDDGMRRLLPFIMAMVGAFAVGILSLSRCYEVPTFTMLGIAAAYLRVVPTYPPVDVHINSSLLKQICLASIVFLGCMYVIVRVMAA